MPEQPSRHKRSPQSAQPPHEGRSERHPALRARRGVPDEEALRAFSAVASAPGERAKPERELGRRPEEGQAQVKRSGKRRSGFGRLVRWVLLPGALAGGAAWALTSPRWDVQGVQVSGVRDTPMQQVQIVAGALRGQNWLRADMAAARSRLSKLPTVQSAMVARAWNHWPPRLAVAIQERKPWVRLGGGDTWWVADRSGVAFRRAERQDRGLYAITSTALDPATLRAGQSVPPKIWDGVRRLADALDQSSRKDGAWPIRRAYLDRDSMASLRLQGGSQDEMLVRLGDGMWPQKLERARRALAFFDAAGRRAQSLNLVSFSTPTWTPLQPSPQPTASATTDATSPSTYSASDQPEREHPPEPPPRLKPESRRDKTRQDDGQEQQGADADA